MDEAEATVVWMVYRWLLNQRLTTRQIRKHLNTGPWSPCGGDRPWSAAVVHYILSE